MARIFGYARPTALQSDVALQAEDLRKAGAETILCEKDGAQARRALRERRRLLDQIAPGDVLLLHGLDRLGTSFDDMLRCLALLVERGVTVRVLDAGFDSADQGNPAYRTLLALLTGARSALASETIKLNLASARAKGGKAPGQADLLKPEQWPSIRKKLSRGTREAVASELGVSRQTLWSFQRRMMAQDESGPAPAPPVRRSRAKA